MFLAVGKRNKLSLLCPGWLSHQQTPGREQKEESKHLAHKDSHYSSDSLRGEQITASFNTVLTGKSR